MEAADHGTHQDLLRALRDRIATAIEDPNAHPRDIAVLSLRLAVVSQELQAGANHGAERDPVAEAAATPDEAWSGI